MKAKTLAALTATVTLAACTSGRYDSPAPLPGRVTESAASSAGAHDAKREPSGDLATTAESPAAPAVASPRAAARAAAADGRERADNGSSPSPEVWRGQGAASIAAGEWDDNANYREFQKYLGTVSEPIRPVDVRSRRFLVVRDAAGKSVPRCPVTVTDEAQHSVTLTTTAAGRAILFPRGEGLVGRDFVARADCAEDRVTARFSLNDDGDAAVDLRLARARQLSAVRPVDLAFVLDTTGSMSEEIASVKATIQKVAATLSVGEVRVRIGLVEYKDRGDAFVTKVYPMSADLAAVSRDVGGIVASGGGDLPENMSAGLHVALRDLEWSPQAVTRAAFIIGDAPPHLDYPNEADYSVDMKQAAHRGIQLFTVAASGMDALGQAVWRQMSAYTGGTNLFVLRGGAGPQSVGGGDPASSCGGTQTNYASGNLDALIVLKIKRELRSIDADPMRIPGLITDENARPCDQRVTFLQ